MIDRIFQIVSMLLNTDGRGNVSPQEKNLAINNSVNQIYESYLFEVNRLVNRANRGLSNSALENLPDRIREKILHYLIDFELVYSEDDETFAIPADLRYIDTLFYNDTEIEPCKNSKEFKAIVNYAMTSPTEQYPIYLQQNNSFKIAPNTIIENVTLNYLRKPFIAKWTYVVVSNVEIYNPSAGDFQDVDIHPSEEYNIVVKTLLQFGINLKESEVVAIASNLANAETENENNL